MPPQLGGLRPWTPTGAAVRLLALALAYYGAARVGLLFSLSHSLASPIWPPAGLAIAFTVLWGPRALPGVLAGAFLVEMGGTHSVGLSVALAVGNASEAFLAGWLIRRAGGRKAFESLPGVARFAGAVLLGALPAATIGAGTLVLGHQVPLAAAGAVWLTWFLGDAAGALVVAPVILLVPHREAWPRTRSAESAAVLLVLLLAAAVVFGLLPGASLDVPLVFLVMPPVVWAAFRLGPALAAASVMALDAIAVAATASGRGAFAVFDDNTAFLAVQAFVFTFGLMALGLAAVANDRRRSAQELERAVAGRTRELAELNDRLRREVDERGKAQAQLAEAHRLAGLGSWTLSLADNELVWSPELRDMFGVQRPGPGYQAYIEAHHPADRAQVDAALQAVRAHPGPFRFDHRIIRPDGEVRHMHCEGGVDVDEKGTPVRLTGASQDVTERLAAQRALSESLVRFSALADASPIGIVHTRSDGIVDYVNDKWRQITGVADHNDREAMRKSVHPEDQPVMAKLWRACVSEGRDFVGEMRFVHRDGVVRWTSCSAVPVRDQAGAVTGFVSTVEDITDRRAAQAKDHEVQRLREQAEFKTNFLRTAAHELGTPLTPILIQLHVLNKLLRASSRPDELKAMAILDRNISRLHVLVRDMLESARLQSGRLKLDPRPVDLAHLVHDVVETFQEPAIQTGVVLDTEGPHELAVVADPDRLSQVLYNLISNAMKFTPLGGHILVRTATEAAGQVRVSVQDSGLGFTPEQAALLFQPFSQLHDPNERVHGGSGLGLYISRGIVEQHGGKLTAHSLGPGKGATFSFVLPRVAEAFQASPPAQGEGRLDTVAPSIAPPRRASP